MNTLAANLSSTHWSLAAFAAALRAALPSAAHTQQRGLRERRALPRHRTHWVNAHAGSEIVCTSGCLWLTYDGQQRDIVLEKGDSHVSEQRGRLAVHALGDAEYLLG